MGNPAQKENLEKYYFTVGTTSGGGTSQAVAKIVTSMAQAYTLAPADTAVGMQVYDKGTGREYILNALPASNASNWIAQGGGDVEDSYRGTNGVFNTAIATQKCNTDQTISGASLPATKKYKIIATADMVVTFDLPVLGSSTLLSGMAWGLRSGSELTFYKTADGSAIDGEVN